MKDTIQNHILQAHSTSCLWHLHKCEKSLLKEQRDCSKNSPNCWVIEVIKSRWTCLIFSPGNVTLEEIEHFSTFLISGEFSFLCSLCVNYFDAIWELMDPFHMHPTNLLKELQQSWELPEFKLSITALIWFWGCSPNSYHLAWAI